MCIGGGQGAAGLFEGLLTKTSLSRCFGSKLSTAKAGLGLCALTTPCMPRFEAKRAISGDRYKKKGWINHNAGVFETLTPL